MKRYIIATVMCMALIGCEGREVVNLRTGLDGCTYIVVTKGNGVGVAHSATCMNPVHLPEVQAALMAEMRSQLKAQQEGQALSKQTVTKADNSTFKHVKREPWTTLK